MRNERRPGRATLIGLVAISAWVAFFAYLLLAADPPDFFFDDIATVDGPAHFVGGATTGLIVYLLVARRPRAIPTALTITIGLLLLLEFVQDRFTSRRYEASDVLLAVLGALAGVGLAVAGAAIIRRRRGN